MRIYGPADLVSAAGTVKKGLDDGTEQLRELVELVPRVVALVGRAEALLDEAEGLVERSERTRAHVQQVSTRAEQLVGRTEGLLRRTERLTEPVEEIAPRAMPIAQSLVDNIDPAELAAMNGLVDRLPSMLDQIDTMGPDVHRILDAVTDLTAAMQGMPGMSVLKRRGERKAEDEDEETPGGHEQP